MVWQMKSFLVKKISLRLRLLDLRRGLKVGAVVSLLALAAFAFPAKAARFCVNIYKLDSGVLVCSQMPLSERQVENANQKYDNSLRLLPKFMKRKGFAEAEMSVRLDIYIVTSSELNDSSLFGKKFASSKLVGRYIPVKGYVFVTPDALTPGNTDLPHELAHWYNDNLDIPVERDNELLAQQFERFYQKHAR